jgi:hypothetical protein
MKTATQQIYFFTYSDSNYKNALNYDGAKYFHDPMTFTINGKTFIVGLSASDRIVVTIHHDKHVYIISENTSLEYISLTYIDIHNNVLDSCYFSENDLRVFGNVFEMPTDEQIAILSNYLSY